MVLLTGLLPGILSQTTGEPQDQKTKLECTVGVADGGRQIMQSVDETFTRDRNSEDFKPVDLAIVIDRSKSITKLGFDYTKATLQALLSYIIKKGMIYVHPLHDRISIFSFGKISVPELNGFRKNDNPVTICEIDTFVEEMTHQQSDQSNVIDILKTVNGAFKDRPEAKKVLWLFFDGENTDGSGSDENATDPIPYARDMRNKGIDIFAAGVGSPAIKGWMDIDKENRVAGLATDKNRYYACVETWRDVLKRKLAEIPYVNPTPPTEAALDRYVYASGGRCAPPDCDKEGGTVCACDTPERAYSCQDKGLVTVDYDKPKTASGGDGVSTTSIIISIVAPIAIIVIFFLALACCVCWKRRERRKRQGPPLPAPPLIQRRLQPQIKIHGTEPNYNNVGDWLGKEDTENIYMEQNDMIYQKVEEVEKEMDGWGDYLIEKAQRNRLYHLSIHDSENLRWASTPGSRIRRREIKDIFKHFQDDGLYVNSDIKVAGQRFKVDQRESRDYKVRAVRKRKEEEETVWIAQEGQYIVVGMSPSALSSECKETLQELGQYIKRYDTSNADQTVVYDNRAREAGDGQVSDDIYDDTRVSSNIRQA